MHKFLAPLKRGFSFKIFSLFFIFSNTLYSLERVGLVANWPIRLAETSEILYYKSEASLTNEERLQKKLLSYGYLLEIFPDKTFVPTRFTKLIVYNTLTKKEMEEVFKRFSKEALVLFIFEPRVVMANLYEKSFLKQFTKVFTFDDALVDNKKYCKFFYPVMRPMLDNRPSFTEKKFCCLFGTNLESKIEGELYTERQRAIKFFENKEEGLFDLYGRRWEKRGYKNYRGAVIDKIAVLQEYKFTISYENSSSQNGYITEKIFDAFHAGVVPIYLGAPNIETYIPKGCFIDKRDFPSYEKLYDFLQNMSEEEYEIYIENIRIFLASKEALFFTSEHFVENFCHHLLYRE
jgi:hypothetical protein